MTAGQQYAIVLESAGEWAWNTDFANNYSGGDAFQILYGGTEDTNGDVVFETFVTPTPPAPGAGPRGGYCTVAGNTTDSGAPIVPERSSTSTTGRSTATRTTPGPRPRSSSKAKGSPAVHPRPVTRSRATRPQR